MGIMNLEKLFWVFVIKMDLKKKSQFFIFIGFLFLSLLVFIYSIETQNNYIVKSTNYNLLDNILFEVCQLGTNSNATNIESRYSNLTFDVFNYCGGYIYICNLTIALLYLNEIM